MVAIISDLVVESSGNPAEKRTSIFRPGTVRKFLARVRKESNIERAPNAASAPVIEERSGVPIAPPLFVSTVLEATKEVLAPLTAACSTSGLAVKFWLIRNTPPNSTTAI